jgi:hypothetical protein
MSVSNHLLLETSYILRTLYLLIVLHERDLITVEEDIVLLDDLIVGLVSLSFVRELIYSSTLNSLLLICVNVQIQTLIGGLVLG